MEIPVECHHQAKTSSGSIREWPWLAMAMILPSCAVLVAWPFADLAFNDDWTYCFTALRYAQSGSIQYNGWSETMIIFQAIYGGLLIRLFGFSFDLLRLATIPFAAGCSALTYLLARRAELPPPVALFASLTATMSPLFLVFAASFMTDVYGCFFLLLGLYLGIHAIDSEAPAHAALWLFAAIGVGVIGGAERQLSWVGPVAVLMCFAWQKRKDPFLLRFAALLAAISAAVILGFILWFAHQPNVFIDKPELRDLRKVPGVLPWLIVQYGLSAILFCLPALVLLFPARRYFTLGRWSVPLAAAGLWTGIGLRHLDFLAPWLGNMVTEYGIFSSGEEMRGDKPIVLGIAVRAVLTALVLFATFVLLQLAIQRLSTIGRLSARVRSLVLLLTLTSLGCAILIGIHTVRGYVADDYLLPWLPWFVIFVLMLLHQPDAAPPEAAPRWGLACAVLILFAGYGIAATHDYYAASRARVQAAERLEAAGVLRRHISGGFEFDGWTRLLEAGHICRPGARPPAGDPACVEAVDPQYYLAFSPVPDLVSSSLPPISFRVWLPPFRRQVVVLTKPSK